MKIVAHLSLLMLLFAGSGTAQAVQYPESSNAGNKGKKLFSGTSACI
jgi:hypothetical protein